MNDEYDFIPPAGTAGSLKSTSRPEPTPTSSPPPPPPPPAHAPAHPSPGTQVPHYVAQETGPSLLVDESVRDRIVLLGRRRAGKTVFLSRLYQELWKGRSDLHLRALSGEAHLACMQAVDELQQERWPPSTLGLQHTDLEITWRGRKRLLVALDYPGEVFRRAFVEDARGADVDELVRHVDHAAALIILLDPAIMRDGDAVESADDDFGMVQAIERIRMRPDGDRVPIAVVFTKCDVHQDLFRDDGGIKGYLKRHYPALVRAMHRYHVFGVAAVRARRGTGGAGAPDLSRSPLNLVKPLEHCLVQLDRLDDERAADRARRERVELYRRQEEANRVDRKRAVVFWTVFWSVMLVVLFAIAMIAWLI